MEDVSLTTELDGPRRDELALALAAQRARVGEFVAAHQQRLRQAETAFKAALARLHQQERELDERRRDHDAEAEELARQRHALQEKRTEVEQAGEALAAERQETKIQRRRIAQEFQAQRATHLKDLQRERDELERLRGELEAKQAALGEAADLAARLEAGRQQCAVLERQLAERADAIEAIEGRLRAAAAVNESLERRLNDALDAATAQRASFEARLAEAQEAAKGAANAGIPADSTEAERLTQTLRDTENRLAETERRLREAERDLAEAPKVQTVRELADAQRRYEMAMEDLREQKQRTSELEKKLTDAPRPSGASAPAGPMDWESQKRRMLAELEANTDDDPGEGERHAERLKIQEVIAQTSATLAGKEKELHELRRQLSDKSSQDAAQDAKVASDAAISNDELVRTERERLRQLQLEWEEKLRQAEVDLSVERAKMARERAEIEEIQRRFNETQSQNDEQPIGAKDKKPQRGRWLARLGLKDDEAG